jgi:hypothetical protein
VTCSECDRSYWYRNGELVELSTLLAQLDFEAGRGKRHIGV